MTEIVFQNKRNPHKYLNVAHYKCGHYYVAQYIRWEANETPSHETVILNTGNIRNRRRRHWWKVGNLKALLEDYTKLYEIIR